MQGDIRETVRQKIDFCKGLITYYRENNIDMVADIIQKDIDAAEAVLADDNASVRDLVGAVHGLARNKYPWQT